MKGIVQHGFGSPNEALKLADVAKPAVEDDGVLVSIRAASIHIGDVYGIRGFPKVMRPMFSSMKAKSGVIGTDIAGTVEAVGKDVTVLKPCDEVFGWCKGAFAEYASTKEDSLTLCPDNLSSEQAAAIGVSAFTALQALRDHGKLQAGQKVLITGASGGVGTFAVQIAKSFGAEVTGVCSTRNIEMVRALGADHVIDYTQQDFTKGGPEYDLILDNIGAQSLKDTRGALKPTGTLLSNGAGAPSGWFGGLGLPLKSAVSSVFVKQQGRAFLSLPNKEDLATLKDLAATGQITPVMDRTYPLDQGISAISHVGEGHAQGTTVITMAQAQQ
ncbi:MAG: NAD(P)-dependent alcohol dehydrogenase [Acidimicrobiia bacterium]